jgi:hypothetical protein
LPIVDLIRAAASTQTLDCFTLITPPVDARGVYPGGTSYYEDLDSGIYISSLAVLIVADPDIFADQTISTIQADCSYSRDRD